MRRPHCISSQAYHSLHLPTMKPRNKRMLHGKCYVACVLFEVVVRLEK